MKHCLTLHYECESKYFGKLSVSSYHEISVDVALSSATRNSPKPKSTQTRTYTRFSSNAWDALWRRLKAAL